MLDNYGLTAAETEFYAKIEGSTMSINTVERQQAGTGAIVTIDLTKSDAVTLYESGYTGILSWVNGASFDLTLSEFEIN